MKKPRRLIACLILTVGLCAGAWYLIPTWLPAVGRWLDVGEVPQRVDYVMSLPGDENYRPLLAAAMIRLHLAERALIVQSESTPEELDGIVLPTSEIIRRVYRYCGVPDSKLVVLSQKSASTSGDIGILAAFLKDHPQATIAIVTSSYHTRRSRWTFHHQLGQSANRLTIVSAPNGDFDIDHWWLTEDGFLLVVMEYVKSAAYLVVYGNVLWWLGTGIVVLGIWRVWRKVSLFRCQVLGSDSSGT